MIRTRSGHEVRHARRRQLASCLIIACVVVVASCSSSGTSSKTSPTPTRVATTTTTVPLPTPQKFAAGDASYFTIPDPIPAGTHGDLLRYQPITESPEGLTWYRIMYLSTTAAGDPTVDTGILTIPDGDPPEGGWKLATHAHGSTGLADDCAPSRTVVSNPGSSAELQVVGRDAAKHGYVVASTDYEGQGGPGRHPFLVGESEGRAVLDAARAARGFPGLHLGDDLAIVGYSQGGHAALWANQIAAKWTPELQVVGTLAGAPASEVASLIADGPVPAVDNPQTVGITAGLEAADPKLSTDLDELLAPAGKKLLQAMDTSCTTPEGFEVGKPLLTADPTTTQPWKRLLAANTPGSVATDDPVLIVHSKADESVLIAQSAKLLARLCTAGQVVERRVLPAGTHVAAAVPAYADGFDWLDGLTRGIEPVDSCDAK